MVPGAELVAAVGPGARVLPFVPGRYAGDVDKRVQATHARNWYSETTRASFVLELAADGGVHGCRGQRSDSNNDGPTVHRAGRRREQQGYRGTWRAQADGWIAVELGLDDRTCEQTRVYTDLAPSPWQLRCARVQAGARPVMLACQLVDEARHRYQESYAHLVPGVLPQRWLLLGAGDGLRVEWRMDSVDGFDDGKVSVAPAPRRIEYDTWSRD